MSVSIVFTRSPNSSLHSNLSSCNQLSNRFLFWFTTMQDSSKDLEAFNYPFVNIIPLYCNKGEVYPSYIGTLWNLAIVSSVCRIPWGEFATRFMASLYFIWSKNFLNHCTIWMIQNPYTRINKKAWCWQIKWQEKEMESSLTLCLRFSGEQNLMQYSGFRTKTFWF